MSLSNIRNFCIIAHINHGKSTLADRFLESTKTVEKRKMREQYLDQMDLERERGITIKLQPVRMEFEIPNPPALRRDPAKGGGKSQITNKSKIQNPNDQNSLKFEIWNLEFPSSKYILNLVDTPGHIDFSYEVSRSLAAVEGAILLVDATKGVQAQTLANFYLAKKQNLAIIPAINKIDLPAARIKETEEEIKKIFEADDNDDFKILKISAKEGTNVEKVLEAIIRKIPPPSGDLNKPLAGLVFDSVYDSYKGVLAYVRIIDGQIKARDKVMLMSSGKQMEILEVGIFKPEMTPTESLKAGEIGYLATGLKDANLCRVGDTITGFIRRTSKPFPGYKEPKPMIFAGFYPSTEADFNRLRDSLDKLKLNDASLFFEPESSGALGRGFKCGFLGMLHLEIIGERLKREYGMKLVATTPSIVYRVIEKKSPKEKMIYSAEDLPETNKLEAIKEPWVKLEIISPNSYLGAVMKLLQKAGGIYKTTQYLSSERVILEYEAPLREIIVDFYDRLKSATSGYASMSYEFIEWRTADLVKLEILVNGEKIAALARIVARDKAAAEGKIIVKKLKDILPKQLFSVAIQVSLDGKIIARETIAALKKDVTGYLYGGDRTRKMKLWQKQKAGKKKLKERGKVNIPHEVFLKMLAP
jgi:GTP-binding protein LepA